MSASPLLRPSCLALALSLALSLACAVPLAHAQTAATDAAVIDYQIAAGPLATGDGVTETMTARLLPKPGTPGSPMKYIRVRVTAP